MENTATAILERHLSTDKRRHQVAAIINLIMGEIEDVLPDDARREIYTRLRHLMDLNGFHIMTDSDRAALGLEPLDYKGWTMTDRMKERARMLEAMHEVMKMQVKE